MKGISLRTAIPHDLPAIVAIVESLPKWFTADAVQKVRTIDAHLPGLVALDEDAVVGFLLWEQRETDCGIKWIAVAPNRHRQGIGRMLVTRLVELMRAAAVTQVRVETLAPTIEYEPYARTRAFYEACGFTLRKIEPRGWPDGSDRAEYVLELSG